MVESNCSDLLWFVVIGFIISFVLAFGIGANDVANSFGTSVGSGVLTLKQACIIATFCEMSGAVLVGFKVSDTMRKGILDVTAYQGAERELMLGCVSALSGSSAWLLIATYLSLPVSSTHSVVGATIGFSLVGRGVHSINLFTLGTIVGSWFISPALSGSLSTLIFMLVRHFILYAIDPLSMGFKALPIIYGLTVFVNLLGIFVDSPALLGLSRIVVWQRVLICVLAAFLVSLITYVAVVPMQREVIMRRLSAASAISSSKVPSVAEPLPLDKKRSEGALSITESLMSIGLIGETEEISLLFASLQILTAMFCSFAHGGNDVSNAIGPLVALHMIYSEGTALQKAETPLWLLFYGGLGISVGLWVLGRRVIETVGKDLTKITTTGGFSIEVGAALTVLLASKLGIPISTTHCKVGSIVLVGLVRSKGRRKPNTSATTSQGNIEMRKRRKSGVDWLLFRHIIYAWMITIPVTASLAAIIMIVLCKVML